VSDALAIGEDTAMFYWIYDLSTTSLVGLFSVFFIGFTWVGAILIRPVLRLLIRREPAINDLIGYILSCYCVFYGLLLGLIAVAAYQNFADTDRTASEEAAAVAALYRDISNYPQPDRGELQDLLREYTRSVIEEDWPAQRRGIVPDGTLVRIRAFLARLASFEPRTKGQEILHAETLRAFNELSKLRRLRAYSVTSGIPAIMWYVVVVGALLNIALVWLFDMKPIAQLFLGGLLSFFIAMVIALIAAMDNPYRGDMSIGPDAFRNVYEGLMEPKNSASRTPAG
jgi:hypothetical protein